MTWLLPRALAALAAMLLGAAAGALVGLLFERPLAVAALGAGLFLVVTVLVDAWRGNQLLDWLRGSQQDGAPRDTGFWGELAYRIEKSLRNKDLALRPF